MLKNISKLECQVNDKIYQFLCDMDSPLIDVKEAVFQFQKYLMQVEEQVKVQIEAAEKAKADLKSEEVMPIEIVNKE